jgi:uncharacterized membrane protein YgdD (TMEM256/DUF423 family)
MISQRQVLMMASAAGFLAVALGAFGAHAWKETLLANGRLDTFELAARYHFYHALALLAIALILDKLPSRATSVSAMLIGAGMILFSGSLYALSFLTLPAIAWITPLGGLFLLAGWLSLFWSVVRGIKSC